MSSTNDDAIDVEARRAHELHALGLRQRDAGAFAAALGTFEATRTIEERLPWSSRRSWDLGMTLHELGWLHAQVLRAICGPPALCVVDVNPP